MLSTHATAAFAQVKWGQGMGNRRSLELIDEIQLSHLLTVARESPRRRAIHCFHTGDGDNPHRFVNLILAGSYVAPHRHAVPPKAESFVVLRGEVGVLLFGDDGAVLGAHRLSALSESGNADARTLPCGLDLLPGTWHSIVALSPTAVIFEVKPGPYDAATDKEFAPWAPREGEPDAAAYLAWMEGHWKEH